jgi:Aspartyl/Asparaginyl beta-hydroxylase
MTVEHVEPAEAVRVLSTYCKHYGAGAFATPMAKELTPEDTLHWPGVFGLQKRLTRDSARKDFTGVRFVLPAGWRVITHLTAEPGYPLPDLREWDAVFAYAEDTALVAGLVAQGRVPYFTRITAAGEIITCWTYGTAHRYDPVDIATAVRLPKPPMRNWDAIVSEAKTVTTWHDDFPYYSDGSWAAISLRGFVRDDPTWGIKPSEMPKKWKDEHPEAMGYRCDWTVLADAMPATVEAIQSDPLYRNLERVRLLRMAGTGKGHLGRHTDITDRWAGTRNGHIVRFHVPLITAPGIVMDTWDLAGRKTSTHLGEGETWYLDARKPHAVTNPTTTDRIHLVMDVVADSDVRDAIRAAVR